MYYDLRKVYSFITGDWALWEASKELCDFRAKAWRLTVQREDELTTV